MDAAVEGGESGRRVRRRHVFYIPGYDPRSPRIYFLLFKRELAKWSARNGAHASLTRSRAADAQDGLSSWSMNAVGEEGRVDTAFDFLAWHDLAKREFDMSYVERAGRAAAVLWYTLHTRLFWDMARWNWRFGLFAAYPWVMAGGYLLVAVAWLLLCLEVGGLWLAPPWSVAVGAAGAAAGVWVWWRLLVRWEPKLYVFYLINDWIWTARHRRQADPAANARFEAFARRVAGAAVAGDADELLLIGHSSGSFVAAIVAARALELADEQGGSRAPLGLLTIGANTVVSAGGRGDNPARRAIASLLTEPRVRWIEFFAPQDIMSFPKLDYRRCYDVDLQGREQVNPLHLSARFGEIFAPDTYRALLWRWFDLHFAFLKANDRPGPYDFYRLLVGSEPFGEGLVERP